ncbi:MAG: hypothetical protein VKI42_09015 [Synechococcaceae cyanobacterium]|nr:hypothetical protein [Synechococcaceae cyanobacterium]
MASELIIEAEIRHALNHNHLSLAISLAYQWLREYSNSLSSIVSRAKLRQPDLWLTIADVAERTSDFGLIETLFQILERVDLSFPRSDLVPLLGVPIVNRPDLLSRLLDSLDVQVDTLAIVDNSRLFIRDCESAGESLVERYLNALQQLGHPLVKTITVAKPFRNLGVAASWNHILTSFPEYPFALIVNNDVAFSPGCLARSIAQINPAKPQFMPLLKEPNSFSAFFLTSLCWDHIGLFDCNFRYAYFEDIDFKDRLKSNPNVEWLHDENVTAAMNGLNQEHSMTIRSNPELAAANKLSYALNKMWYLSPRRFRGNTRGIWRRLWLAQWD